MIVFCFIDTIFRPFAILQIEFVCLLNSLYTVGPVCRLKLFKDVCFVRVRASIGLAVFHVDFIPNS